MPAITIADTAQMLNQHSVVFAPDLKQVFRQGLEFEAILPFTEGDEYYAAGNVTIGDVFQPYQGGFTPNGTIAADEAAYKIRPIKMDQIYTEDDLQKWYASYFRDWFEAGRNPMEWTFPKYILEMIMMPKMMEELNNIAWNGTYTAPTPGTPGAYLDSCDGFNFLIQNLDTAGKISKVASGTYNISTIRAVIETWLDGIPNAATSKGGKILMSKSNRRKYLRDYRSEFMHTPTLIQQTTGPQTVMIDDYNIEIVGVAAMEGSNRWIFLPNTDRNMFVATRRGFPTYPQFIFDTQPRVLQVYSTIYRAFGFEYPANVFINDQA